MSMASSSSFFRSGLLSLLLCCMILAARGGLARGGDASPTTTTPTTDVVTRESTKARLPCNVPNQLQKAIIVSPDPIGDRPHPSLQGAPAGEGHRHLRGPALLQLRPRRVSEGGGAALILRYFDARNEPWASLILSDDDMAFFPPSSCLGPSPRGIGAGSST